MARRRFKIKTGDDSPALTYELFPKNIVLLGASVVFNMRLKGADANTIDRGAAVIVDPGDGTEDGTPTVAYEWAAGDTAVAGEYVGEFEVTYADGAVETFDNDDEIPILIRPDLG